MLDPAKGLAGSNWAILLMHVVPSLCISSLLPLQGVSAEMQCPMQCC